MIDNNVIEFKNGCWNITAIFRLFILDFMEIAYFIQNYKSHQISNFYGNKPIK